MKVGELSNKMKNKIKELKMVNYLIVVLNVINYVDFCTFKK